MLERADFSAAEAVFASAPFDETREEARSFRAETGEGGAGQPAPISSKLDLSPKLFQRSILPSVQAVAQGRRLEAPLVVDLDPTSFCDLACPECISSNVLNNGQFAPTRLKEIAAELVEAGVKGVILIGGGEPLMHRSIGEVIRTLSDGGVRLGMVTNGTLIDRHIEVLAERMSWIRVSMDAADADVYDRFRPSGRRVSVFPTVIANMELLASRKKGRLGYSFLLMQRRGPDGSVVESNYDQVFAAGSLAKSVGCDYFEIKAVFDMDHFVIQEDEDDILRVQEQLERLAQIETDDFRVLRSSTWTALRAKSDPEQKKDYHRCAMAELRATITPGGVFTCAYHRGADKGRIGDMHGMSLRQMWRQAETSRIDPAADCRFHCARHASNLAIARLAEGETVTVIDDYDPFI